MGDVMARTIALLCALLLASPALAAPAFLMSMGGDAVAASQDQNQEQTQDGREIDKSGCGDRCN